MKKLLAVLILLIMIFSSFMAYAGFDDIDSNTLSWAGMAIEGLTELNVINGYTDGTFRPHNNVTRAEFAKMTSVAFSLEKVETEYSDIADHWAEDYIRSVADAMYTQGSAFMPDSDATRADIAYCISALLKLEASNEEAIKKFSDYNEINSAMLKNLCAAADNGIIAGYEDNTLRPQNPVTRAEAATIIWRAMELKDKDEKPQEPDLPPSSEDEKDSLSKLYPGKDLILIVSVNQTVNSDDGEDAYKITYKLANAEKEYTSVVPYDTPVTGVKTDISTLSAGDVLIMNTAFRGYIGNLHVFAAFGDGIFNFDHTITGYGKGAYTIAGGKIKEIKRAGKNIAVILEADGVDNTVYIPLNLEANVFSEWNKKDKWSYGGINDVDPNTEEEYAFIRYTNGLATDLIVSDFIR